METIVGCVKGSAGGTRKGGEWQLVFFLQPFRIVGGPVVEQPEVRVVAGPISERALTSRMQGMRDGDVVSCRVDKLTKSKRLQSWQALGVLPIRKGSDDALSSTRASSAKKVVVRDGALGTLTLDRRFNWWHGTRKYRGRSYMMEIEGSKGGEESARDKRDVARARVIVLRIEKDVRTIRGAIVKRMLSLYNGTWRGEAPELGERAFVRRLSLSSVNIDPRGRSRLTFSADGMFTDHAIAVDLTAAGKVGTVKLV